MPKFLL